MKITDICWITPLKNVDICWITHYRPVLAYPQAAAGAYHIWLCHCPFILIASASFLGAYLIIKLGKCAYKNNLKISGHANRLPHHSAINGIILALTVIEKKSKYLKIGGKKNKNKTC
jgi:hypothetical protein